MGRQRKSDAEKVIELVSRYPWWIGISLAPLSFFFLNAVAGRTIAAPQGSLTAVMFFMLVKVFAGIGQYFFPLIFVLGGLVSAITAARNKKLYDRVASSQAKASMDSITWGEFESIVGEYFRRHGFVVQRKGGNGPDGGADLELHKKSECYLVQCKQWKAYKVGVQPVRELYGVMASRGAAGGFVVTSGVFTEEAKKFARGLNVELIDGDRLKTMMEEAREKVSAQVPPSPQTPSCPKCGSQMKKRVARQGAQAGNEFWGCSTYPKCHGTLPLQQLPQEPEIAPSFNLIKKSCPVCGGDLVLRQFQSGPKAGQEFLGCIPCKKGWPLNAGG
ncbi:membrane protein [Geomonas silvestris]|uniref:Membrane protein n=1 Tax=Geomonas silvestris TaxID=2740184 RepID=A0A6V8MKH7_9BACT|nr:restriction endonuclease [Geomonas silvestris]GFO60233.1 membrane protein [Geomonas silvestris]